MRLLAILVLAASAGCVDITLPDDAPAARDARYPAFRPVHDENRDELAADGCQWYSYNIPAPSKLSYSLLVRDGGMSIYVMDKGEEGAFCEGQRFRYYSGYKDMATVSDTADLSAGSYVVGVRCSNYIDPCPYDLTIRIQPR